MNINNKIETQTFVEVPNFDNLKSLSGDALQDASTILLLNSAHTMAEPLGKCLGKLFTLWSSKTEKGDTQFTFGEWAANATETWKNEQQGVHNLNRGLSLSKEDLEFVFGKDTDMSPIMLTCGRQIYGTAKTFIQGQKTFRDRIKNLGSVHGICTALKSLRKTRAA